MLELKGQIYTAAEYRLAAEFINKMADLAEQQGKAVAAQLPDAPRPTPASTAEKVKEPLANGVSGGAAAADAAEGYADIPEHMSTATNKRAPRAKKTTEAPPVAEPAATAPVVGKLTFDQVKARLSDYSADKRYGMEGVIKLLAEFGQERITKLPEDQYQVFVMKINENLALPADPLS